MSINDIVVFGISSFVGMLPSLGIEGPTDMQKEKNNRSKNTIKIIFRFLMQISVIGAGYVGCVTGICLAEIGHNVILVDRDSRKLETILSGKSPVFECGLDNLLIKNHERILTTGNIQNAVCETELTIVCVGTPQNEDGSTDLQFVKDVAVSIGKAMKSDNRFRTVIIKSTVLPGTTENIIMPILEKESGKRAGEDFNIAMNPEFLKEGCAVEDFFHTDRIVIGAQNQKTRNVMDELYKPMNAPLFYTSIKTAEMIKYVSNAFLATKIELCKRDRKYVQSIRDRYGRSFQGSRHGYANKPAFFPVWYRFWWILFSQGCQCTHPFCRIAGC